VDKIPNSIKDHMMFCLVLKNMNSPDSTGIKIIPSAIGYAKDMASLNVTSDSPIMPIEKDTSTAEIPADISTVFLDIASRNGRM